MTHSLEGCCSIQLSYGQMIDFTRFFLLRLNLDLWSALRIGHFSFDMTGRYYALDSGPLRRCPMFASALICLVVRNSEATP